jgi:hypothetical protein
LQVWKHILGAQTVSASTELGIEPVDEEIADEQRVPGHVVQEQRFPDLPVTSRLGKLHQGTIAASRVEAAVDLFGHLMRPRGALGADCVLVTAALKILGL